MKINLLHVIGFFVGFILAFFLLFILQGCAPTVRTVTEYRDSLVYEQHWDTLIVHQTDSVDRYRSGDTVYLNRWRVKEVLQVKHDTIHSTALEKVPYEVEVEKEVVPSWCWWLVAIVGVFILYKVGRLALKIYTQGRV